MGVVRKPTATEHDQDSNINAHVAADHDATDSEYFRDVTRLELASDIAAIRKALVKAEQSGEPKPFDIEAFKDRMAKQSA